MLTTSGNRPGVRVSASTSSKLAGLACLFLALTLGLALTSVTAIADPFQFGTVDEDKEQSRFEAQKALQEVGANIDIQGADIVRIGSSYAVDQDEVVNGDIVIIGGALTVEGKINGDAAVIGGSMYLASTSVIAGDAVVIGGILQKEDGAVIRGQIVENPEKAIYLSAPEPPEESGNVRMVEPVEPAEPPEPRGPSGQGYHVSSDEGDIVKVSEDIHVRLGEVVKGDVVTVSADITIDGEVQGDVVATSGDVELSSTARVHGDVVAVFGDIEMADGAQVDGEVVTTDFSGKHVVVKRKGGEDIEIGQDADQLGKLGEIEKMDELRKLEKLDQERKLAKLGGMVTYNVSLFAPQAGDVRLTGSFINWDPEGIKMTRDDDGTWRTTYSYKPGTYLYKFIVDGKAIPDPDVPDKQVSDDMGGYATQLIVPFPKTKTAVPIRFSLARPDARDVRVTGSFNGWDSEGIRMTKDEKGTWSVLVPIAPGNVTYKFYIDGVWGPDPDVAEQVDDGQGGFATPFTVKTPEKSLQLKGGLTIGGPTKEKAGTSFSPAFDYNRVDGVYLAFILSNKSNLFPMPRFYLEGGHSKKRDRWLYSFELEQPIAAPFLLSVGGSFYDKTDSYDKEIITDGENVLVTSLLKRDYRDYFDRRGVTGFAALRPFDHHMLKISYTSDEYRPLETEAHTAIFRKHSEFPTNPHNSSQICYNPENESVTCDEIALKSIALKSMGLLYEFDSRDSKPSPGIPSIWARLGSEWAGRDFGGDLDFSRYTADLRFYNRISAKQKYAVRLAAGGMGIPENAHCPCVPGPEYFFPKQFYVGGIGTLPGYNYKEFRGTHMLLMNIEYSYFLKGSKGIVFFVDGGDADVLDAMKLKFDAGVGLRIEDSGGDGLTLGVAKRLDDSDRDLVVMVRASRPF